MAAPTIFQKILGKVAYNVLAVYAVLAVAIKCGGEKLHKGRKPDCGFS
jgi:hypothetical protein